MKFSLNKYSYEKPTPLKMRKLGDSLFAASTFLTTTAICIHHEWIAVFSALAGFAGKFLTSFYREDDKDAK